MTLRLWTDFNAISTENQCWILKNPSLDVQDLDPDSLREGVRVILFQDEGDFEVEATIHFGFVSAPLHGTAWHAVPDWDTLVYL